GSAKYAIDFTTPGMLYAAIEIAPVYGGRLRSVDATPAESMPGVKKVVKLEEAVAVVADSFWRARPALAAPEPGFSDPGPGGRVHRVDLCRLRCGYWRATGGPEGRGQGRHRRLPRPIPRPRHDGADGVHGKSRRRSR